MSREDAERKKQLEVLKRELNKYRKREESAARMCGGCDECKYRQHLVRIIQFAVEALEDLPDGRNNMAP